MAYLGSPCPRLDKRLGRLSEFFKSRCQEGEGYGYGLGIPVLYGQLKLGRRFAQLPGG